MAGDAARTSIHLMLTITNIDIEDGQKLSEPIEFTITTQDPDKEEDLVLSVSFMSISGDDAQITTLYEKEYPAAAQHTQKVVCERSVPQESLCEIDYVLNHGLIIKLCRKGKDDEGAEVARATYFVNFAVDEENKTAQKHHDEVMAQVEAHIIDSSASESSSDDEGEEDQGDEKEENQDVLVPMPNGKEDEKSAEESSEESEGESDDESSDDEEDVIVFPDNWAEEQYAACRLTFLGLETGGKSDAGSARPPVDEEESTGSDKE